MGNPLLDILSFLQTPQTQGSGEFPSLAYLGTAYPGFLAVRTLLLTLVLTIVIETLGFRPRTARDFGRTLLWSIIVNLVAAGVALGIAQLVFELSLGWITRIGIFLGCTAIILVILGLKRAGGAVFGWTIGSILFGLFITQIYIPFFGMMPPPPHPARIIFELVGSMLPGFGFKLGIEGIGFPAFLKRIRGPKTLIIVNVISFLVLSLYFIAISPNPYWEIRQPTLDYLVEEIRISPTPDKFVNDLSLTQCSTLYILGLSHDPASQSRFARNEFELIRYTYPLRVGINEPPRFFLGYNPAIGLAIIDYALSSPILIEQHRSVLRWFRTYLQYWSTALDAVQDGNQTGLDSVYTDWIEWYDANPDWNAGLTSYMSVEMPTPARPSDAIRTAIRQHEASLIVPPIPD
jgi:hypothetical protein